MSQIIDAHRPFSFPVTKFHLKEAKQGDPRNCVLGRAIDDAMGGLGLLKDVQVGSTITKLYYDGDKVVRYSTPEALKKAIPVFDRTGVWTLPLGVYTLLPVYASAKLTKRDKNGKLLQGREHRWTKHKNSTQSTGRDVFKARSLATRKVKRLKSK